MRFVYLTLSLIFIDPAAANNIHDLNNYDAKLAPVEVSPLNADRLSGTTLVAVVNKTHSPIREISCDGTLWGTHAIAVPGGRIPSGGIGIVDFAKGNCKSGMHIRTGDGQMHDINGQDVSALTILTIESEDW